MKPQTRRLLITRSRLQISLITQLRRRITTSSPITHRRICLITHAFRPITIKIRKVLALSNSITRNFSHVKFRRTTFIRCTTTRYNIRRKLCRGRSMRRTQRNTTINLKLSTIMRPLVTFKDNNIRTIKLRSIKQICIKEDCFKATRTKANHSNRAGTRYHRSNRCRCTSPTVRVIGSGMVFQRGMWGDTSPGRRGATLTIIFSSVCALYKYCLQTYPTVFPPSKVMPKP